MKKLAMVLVVAFLSMALLPAAARAGGYLGLEIGGYFPEKGLLEDADTGLGVGLALGYRFLDTAAVEIGLGGYQTKIPVYVMGARTKTTFTIIPITADVLVGAPLGSLRPYVRAGAGYYLVEIDQAFGDPESGGATGYQVGVGLAVQRFAIEYRRIAAKPEVDGDTFDLTGGVIAVSYGF